jgi:FKBP-type peptidyl-prolyl cis-trans isomerase
MVKRSVVEGLLAWALWTFSTACGSSQPEEPAQPKGAAQIEEIATGSGAEAAPNKTLSVHYVTRLGDGVKLDSSRDRGTPLKFSLGGGTVVPSWELAMRGMRVGGKRRVTIPPASVRQIGSLAGLVPADATLVFEIELLKVD